MNNYQLYNSSLNNNKVIVHLHQRIVKLYAYSPKQEYRYFAVIYNDNNNVRGKKIAVSMDYQDLHKCILDVLKWWPNCKIKQLYIN